MMLSIRNLVYPILFHFVIGLPQINLDLTDGVSSSESDVVSQHDCIHVAASIENGIDPHQVISYCMSEWPSKWIIQRNNQDQIFTFYQLFQQNITSEQLYHWSAPLDIVERYQLYLNQFSNSNEFLSMAMPLFYNCTSPRFGPLCQYSLDAYEPHHSSLNEIVSNFYFQKYLPTTLTCYIHLQCYENVSLACLDWTDICDGTVDCENGMDEEPCWQLEINTCEDNEYQCYNGQCIPIIFHRDNPNTFECLDHSDESDLKYVLSSLATDEPIFAYEDVTCPLRHTIHDVKLTSSCLRERHNLLLRLILFDAPKSVSNECWSAFKCLLDIPDASNPICFDLCKGDKCRQIINATCPDMLYLPSKAIVFGHIYLVYITEDSNQPFYKTTSPQYVCYNEQFCSGFHPNSTLLSFNNSICRRPKDFPFVFNSLGFARDVWKNKYILPLYQKLFQCNTIVYSDPAVCNSSSMYQCINSSKCISKNHVCDGIKNCNHGDDEQCSGIDLSCLGHGSNKPFKCTTTNFCVPQNAVENMVCDCPTDPYDPLLCDDENPRNKHYIRKHISFPTICDGFTELIPVSIDGRNETDETECEYWKCNNTYTRCDGFWNCYNGADEIYCDPSPPINCPSHHHICVSSKTHQLMCLSLDKTNDGNIDCLGAIDEPKLCRTHNYQWTHSDVENALCEDINDADKPQILYFSLDEKRNLLDNRTQENTNIIIPHSSTLPTIRQYQQRCHRGLAVHVWLDSEKNVSDIACLCPPSFYGNMCQYQNQRVAVTMQCRVFSDSLRTLFSIVISLIDNSNERIIHSYHQFTYVYIRDCQTKFNTYLLYATRPKNQSIQYAVHIDIYEKISLAYRGSLFIPLNFTFLPVHRVAIQLDIPRIRDYVEDCSNHSCAHGRCIRYSNDPKGNIFCQCNPEWSGRYCNIPRTNRCNCSFDSLCIGMTANNRSLCVCPIYKWGSHCLLQNTVCQNIICQNGGQCISVDEYMISDKKFICICSDGYTGEKCEISNTIITVSFDKGIALPQSIFFHFIREMHNTAPENGSTFKSITTNQKSVTINWPRPFHVAFVELPNKNFHLITVQKIYKQSANIIQTISSSNRCKNIKELFNETIIKYHLLRRIKYYHIPCQISSPQLSCFYDEVHFCLCNNFGYQRVANCFEFNHTMKHDCFGKSSCVNDGQCLQDKAICPQTAVCICRTCFFGAQCQFSSHLFGLSLDAVLGYYIQPHINMLHQPSIVQISVALTIIIMIAGLVNGVLSVITFKNYELHEIGSDFYLLGSSVTTLLTTTIFALKFWILIIAQMTYITNRPFLRFQCWSMDFLLQICLNMGQWLNACVAMDRTMVAMKGVNFNKEKSRKVAKYVMFILLIIIIGTIIHDPLHRRLLDDDDDDNNKRIWCISTYVPALQLFNSIVNIFHFFGPFIINLSSASIIITVIARQQKILHPGQSYQTLIREEFQHHSHLFISPLILLILAIPRLIISFTSGCMTSNNNAWLLLTGYFISFIPSMITFIIFVFPSKVYKQRFWKNIEPYRQIIQTRLQPAPNRLVKNKKNTMDTMK
ncbi:unnamed protein product [Adineta steineri]|uniref:Uncharacterized protein n=1 Tax=Adineta steineri TaxID=433720 RepID=A0A818VJC3_9BILA|nr:unnamed protein product [Adineta steineri]